MNFEAQLSATISSTKLALNDHNNLEELEEESSKQCNVKNSECRHGLSVDNACTKCGVYVKDETAVAFGYIHEGLKISQEEIIKLRESNLKNMLENRKLCLILDLDHTLVNSTDTLSPQEESLKDNFVKLELVWGTMFAKLRPGIEKFLEEASQMYEMYVYTLGQPWYASEIVKLLDPQEKYFKCRVISYWDCTNQFELEKGLDIVLAPENAVVVLDDRADVWTNHPQNLVLMKKYHYFETSPVKCGLTSSSLSELGEDENEEDGSLMNILRVLKDIHTRFFNTSVTGDVKLVMQAIRQEVLEGCVLSFIGFGKGKGKWKGNQTDAVTMGALCCESSDPRVTHVVIRNATSVKSCLGKNIKENYSDANRQEAKSKKFVVWPEWIEAVYYSWKQEAKKFVVLPEWIEAVYYSWKRELEENFLL